MIKLKKFPKRIIAALCVFAMLIPATAVVAESDVENDCSASGITEVTANNSPTTETDEEGNTTPAHGEPAPMSDFLPLSSDNNLTIDVIKVNGIDVIEIQNPTNRAISCKGMYLTDDLDDLYKWQMPSVIVREEAALVKGINDETTQTLKRMMVNFGVSEVTNLYLTDASGNVLSEWVRGGNQQDGYLRIPEWNIKFATPNTITDVRYKIVMDIQSDMETVHGAIYFVARPVDADVQFVADLETKFTEYSARYLLRMSEATFAVDDIPKIGDYWFVPFSNRTELELARTGAIYGEMNDTNADLERTANNGISEMFRTIQTAKP